MIFPTAFNKIRRLYLEASALERCIQLVDFCSSFALIVMFSGNCHWYIGCEMLDTLKYLEHCEWNDKKSEVIGLNLFLICLQ